MDPGEDVEVAVDLATLFPTLESEFSGYLHVKARVTSEADEPDQSVSPGLYFHVEDNQPLIYDEKALRFTYRAGDFRGEVAETEDVVNEEEDSSLVRVVAEEAVEQLDREPGADALRLGSGRSSSSAGNGITQVPDPQFVSNQTLCVNFEVDTTDSGYTNSVGITEDYWASANSGITTLGYGAHVKIGTTDYITNTVGCVTFTSPGSSYTANVRVYARATDANNSYIRLHDGASNTQDDYPGATYSWLQTNVAFSSGTTKYVAVGGYGARSTTFAALAHSLSFYHDGASNIEYHVSDLGGESPDVDLDCSANTNYFNDSTNNEAYIKLVSDDPTYCPYSSQRTKFVLAHEYGHAYGHQRANILAQTPASTSHSATPAGTCEFTTGGGFSAYGNNTKEWSSLAIREGFAHFISASVWNADANDGQFRWDSSFDLDRWNAGNTAGGYLVNTCCPGGSASCAASLDGAGVITDWMRGLWDMNTDPTCVLSRTDMGELYADLLNQAGLANDNFYPKSASVMLSNWGSTCANQWEYIACYNGIDRQGVVWSGC